MEGDSLYGKAKVKKYGATCNHLRNTTSDVLVKHDVSSSDTLQGISLRYGCTTEQIRRANRLYASDSLFSRPYLMVPVSKGSPHYPAEPKTNLTPSNNSTTTTLSIEEDEVDDDDDHWPHSKLFPAHRVSGGGSSSMDLPSTSSTSSNTHPTAMPRVELLSPEEEQKKDLDELLGKIDSTIASSRRFVTKSQDSSDYGTVDDDVPDYEGMYQNASSSSSSGHLRNASGSSFHGTDDTANLITNSRQVKSSLQRLERTQDELFEL